LLARAVRSTCEGVTCSNRVLNRDTRGTRLGGCLRTNQLNLATVLSNFCSLLGGTRPRSFRSHHGNCVPSCDPYLPPAPPRSPPSTYPFRESAAIGAFCVHISAWSRGTQSGPSGRNHYRYCTPAFALARILTSAAGIAGLATTLTFAGVL